MTLRELGLQSPTGYRVEVLVFYFDLNQISNFLGHFKDLYEDVDYGILSPQTKIKVKVNPSGVVILRADVQPERVQQVSKRPYNPFYYRYNN